MADNGLHVQRFKVTDNAKEAVQIAKELSKCKTLRRKLQKFMNLCFVYCSKLISQ